MALRTLSSARRALQSSIGQSTRHRNFSTSASSLLSRAYNRREKFYDLIEKKAFDPELSVFQSMTAFLNLNGPKTELIDIHEFLEGARYSTEQIMRCLYSEDFKALVCGDATCSESAEYLKKVVSDEFYEVLTDSMREYEEQSKAMGIQRQLKQTSLVTCSVVGINFFARRVESGDTDEEKEDEEEEGLQIKVKCDFEELFQTEIEGKTEKHQNLSTSIWTFESLTNALDKELDWNIIGLK